MEPFNIRIIYKGQELTLTIFPEDDMLFTVVYYGGILGAIQKCGADWTLLDGQITSVSGLPEYRTGYKNSRTEIELNTEVAEYLGVKIEQALSGSFLNNSKPIPAHRRRIKD